MRAWIAGSLLAGGLLSASFSASPKGAEGLVILHGRIENAAVGAEVVTFEFTGEFSFDLRTAAWSDPESRIIKQKFDVARLPIRIPRWGNGQSDSQDPYVVNFRNAARHAEYASRSGEPVDIALFRPIISYDVSGVMILVGCTHAQVMPSHGPPPSASP